MAGETLHTVRQLVRKGDVRVSAHGYDEIAADGIRVRDVIEGIEDAVVGKIIQIMLKAPVFSYCSMTAQDKRFTLCGASQRDTLHPPS